MTADDVAFWILWCVALGCIGTAFMRIHRSIQQWQRDDAQREEQEMYIDDDAGAPAREEI